MKQDRLIDIIKAKVNDKLIAKVIIAAIKGFDTQIMETNVHCRQGVPQGSCLSPWLFNLSLDRIITEALNKIQGIDKIVAYADDIAICGSFKFKELKTIFENGGFKINLSKSASFRKRFPGLPFKKTYRYLGTILNDRGLPAGKTKIAENIKKKSKNLARIGKFNPVKGMRLLMSLCGGLCNFHTKRQSLNINPGSLVKNVLNMNKSLNNHTAAMIGLAILKKDAAVADEYTKSILKLAKLNGVMGTKKRIIIYWSDWFYSINYLDNKYNKLKVEIDTIQAKTKEKNKQKRKKKLPRQNPKKKYGKTKKQHRTNLRRRNRRSH